MLLGREDSRKRKRSSPSTTARFCPKQTALRGQGLRRISLSDRRLRQAPAGQQGHDHLANPASWFRIPNPPAQPPNQPTFRHQKTQHKTRWCYLRLWARVAGTCRARTATRTPAPATPHRSHPSQAPYPLSTSESAPMQHTQGLRQQVGVGAPGGHPAHGRGHPHQLARRGGNPTSGAGGTTHSSRRTTPHGRGRPTSRNHGLGTTPRRWTRCSCRLPRTAWCQTWGGCTTGRRSTTSTRSSQSSGNRRRKCRKCWRQLGYSCTCGTRTSAPSSSGWPPRRRRRRRSSSRRAASPTSPVCTAACLRRTPWSSASGRPCGSTALGMGAQKGGEPAGESRTIATSSGCRGREGRRALIALRAVVWRVCLLFMRAAGAVLGKWVKPVCMLSWHTGQQQLCTAQSAHVHAAGVVAAGALVAGAPCHDSVW